MGLTDKHLAYGDDIPQTQAEKDYYWKIKHLEEQNNKLKEAYNIAIEALEQKPCEKTGKWIEDANKIDAQFGRHTYICSECGKYAEYFVSGTEVWWDRIKPNFCPNCGAKMEVSE